MGFLESALRRVRRDGTQLATGTALPPSPIGQAIVGPAASPLAAATPSMTPAPQETSMLAQQMPTATQAVPLQPAPVGGLAAATPTVGTTAITPRDVNLAATPPILSPTQLTSAAAQGAAVPTASPQLQAATQAGTSILGPSATMVGNTMYTSDGRIITNPIVSDYQQYGLTAPRGTPTVSPRYTGPSFASQNVDRSRRETEYTGAEPVVNPNQAFVFDANRQLQNPNPYAAFGTGQDVNKAYLSQSGSIILPDGRVIQNPTQADYEQYDIGLSQAFGKGAFTKDEKSTYNQIIKAGEQASRILRDSLIANGVDRKTANQMAGSVKQDYLTQAKEYRGQAYLPGAQSYEDYYSMSPEEFLGNLPEEQRSFRPSAEQIFNSLSPESRAQGGINTADDAQKILDANPDFKVNLTPEMIRSMADSGDINLGTKLVGLDYDSLKTTDPVQLKAINEATNKFNLGLNLLNDWGLLQSSQSGKTRTGVSIVTAAAIAQGLADGILTRDEMKQLLPNQSARSIKQLTEFANDMAKLRGDESVSLADLQSVTPGAKAPKLIDPENQIYAVTSVKYKKGNKYIFAQKVGDDEYRIVGGTSMFTPTGGGGFWKYLPVIASIGLSFIPGLQGLGGTIGRVITGAATAGIPEAVLGNAILGAAKAGLTGGDIGIGALTGGVGGGVGQYLSGLDFAGLPLRTPVVGGLANMAAGTVGNLATGQPIEPGIIGGLTGIGAGILAPEVSQAVGNVLPAGTPNVLNQAVTGGLLGAGIGSITGQDPAVLGTMGAVNPLVNYAVGQTGLTGVPAGMAAGAIRGAAQMGLTGGDIGLGLGAGAIAPVVSYGFDQFGNYVGLDRFGRPVGR